MNPEDIETTITAKITDAQVGVQDITGSGDHYQVLVVSQEFEGKSMLEQHRLVMDTLKEAFAENLHAVQLKTFTPDQWQQQA